ncbi:ABC transporter ATP-binding protein [Dyella sp. M7H15-1]|nr:ABC transporter ATP-binding protein [Dyella sp. M7H15-1]
MVQLMSSTPALVVKDLRKTYGNGVQALKGISLTVRPGDFFALLGPNGAGKSTLIGILSSLVNSTNGDAEIFGVSVNKRRNEAMKLIGLVPQEINFNQFEKPFDICVNEAGFYGIPRKIAAERAEKYLKELRLWEKAQDQARMLSGGMKRRLMIARAMMNEPRLLILDEPTAGVDIEIRRSMWQFISGINAAGTTVILTTHYLEEAEQLCRNIAIIDHGTIVENTTMKQLLAKLDVETFVFDAANLPEHLPILTGITFRRIDERTLEAEMPRTQAMNTLFEAFSTHGISVTSMRNKTNRLEELFVRLVENGRQQQGRQEQGGQEQVRQESGKENLA